jgi:hypothetical protein
LSPASLKSANNLPVEMNDDDKLRKLLAFTSQLERTPDGSAELQHRKQLFGECTRKDGETAGQFCARLRHWLDRDLPRTKSAPCDQS